MAASPKVKHPARRIEWWIVDSSNVEAVGWDNTNGMYVRYKHGANYLYHGVSRQRAVACARAASVGKYINEEIKPNFTATLLP